MKKFILSLVLFLVLGCGVAFWYVMNIDWNQHKDKIAEQFYNITGKEIVFDGRVGFKIFPSPYLKASNAKVYNSADKTKAPLMEIRDVVAELSLPALMKKEFYVTRMVLDGAVVNIDWDGEEINWQGDLSADQRQMMEESNMVLNSVTLKNTEVNITSADTTLRLTNLNGEVSAQSVFGPFRIEGNYLKGNVTEGFAITVGKLSENFATTLSGVVTDPNSNSYVRFDGNFHLNNKQLNGNVILESQKLSDFVNANTDKFKLSSEYNSPVALGFDVDLNKQNLSLSNIVLKYGETQGAGTFQMVLDDASVPEIETEFNFSDLDLDPVVKIFEDFYNVYKEKPYNPEYEFDLTAKVKAVRAQYNGQGFKNLSAEAAVDTDTITLNNFSIILPGDTDVKLQGSLYPVDGEVYYQVETDVTSSDILRTLQWLKIDPKASVGAVYKKMLASAKIMGNFDKIQISPYKITLDKSTFLGEAGIVLGNRKDMMIVVRADTVNFDNYISPLPEEEKKKSWIQRMKYRFAKLDVLKDIDLVFDAKADLIIYESMPFEKVDIKSNVLNGMMDVEYCKIEQIANTSLEFKGKVKGFGDDIQVDNLQYQIKSKDVASLINKLEIDVPDLDYKKFNNVTMNGAINGGVDNFGINSSFDIGNMNARYQGQIFKESGVYNYKGNLEIKHPDFSKFLTNLKVGYQPSVQNLGLFQLSSAIDGNLKLMSFNNFSANVGYSNFSGNLEYDATGDRLNITTDMKINKFEADKFMPKYGENSVLSGGNGNSVASFLEKNNWSRTKIDYSPYIYTDMKGRFDIGELSFHKSVFKDAKFNLDLAGGVADVKDFSAVYNNTPVKGNASLTMIDSPVFTIQGSIENAQVNDFLIGGRNYGIKDGDFSLHFDFSSAADSEMSFISKLNGKADFRATGSVVNGLGLTTIYNDLVKREETSGLVEFVKSNIGTGRTAFDKVEGRLVVKDGKYSLADASMTAPNTVIKIYGEGSLADWDMNVVFNVQHEEPRYIPEYSFSLKNSMADPTVDVDVSSLFKLYQSKEDKKEAARIAEVEAEKAYWNEQIAEQKKTAGDVVNSTRSKLEKSIDILPLHQYNIDV
ncbi:MAG: AsmA family protein, partial [Alphaproteobacteria bacterium]|nr:AsmA family protein [Alphaproteobacteria bacterium]